MSNIYGEKLSKKLIAGISIIGILVILIIWFGASYNGLIKRQVEVDKSWGNVQSVYQRRADLIPNLVNTVKGFAKQELTVFTEVTNARSAWANAKTTEKQVNAANGLESAISRLLLVVENYPLLKSDQNFLALQDELAGTENRINVERQRYNEAVSEYNKRVRVIPSNIVAGLFGFEQRTFFEAASGAENAPNVAF
ncbi:LemA family protein [Candidatus Woesearchaeota archaeon]|nr:LemA family protein [Candidatus Woesearchaeota archaeon]